MRAAAFVAFVAAAMVACGGRADSGSAATANVPGGRTALVSNTAAPAAGLIEPIVRAICDSVAARWRAVPGVVVASTDTLDSPYAAGPTTAGCVVNTRSETGVDSTHARATFWALADSAGWIPLWQYSSDGPNGGSLTWEHAGVRCDVRQSSEGDDDSDSTYVPKPWSEERTFCWRYTGPPSKRPVPEPFPPAAGAIMGSRLQLHDDAKKRLPDTTKKRP
jgi:hypothetical protein